MNSPVTYWCSGFIFGAVYYGGASPWLLLLAAIWTIDVVAIYRRLKSN